MAKKIKKDELVINTVEDFLRQYFPKDANKKKPMQTQNAYDFGADLAVQAFKKHVHLLSK